MKTKTVSLRMPVEAGAALSRYAAQHGVTPSAAGTAVLGYFLERLGYYRPAAHAAETAARGGWEAMPGPPGLTIYEATVADLKARGVEIDE